MANHNPRKGKHFVLTKDERLQCTKWADRLVTEGEKARAAFDAHFGKLIENARADGNEPLVDRYNAMMARVFRDAQAD